MRLSVKNWGEFQHYKNRKPPWIKLHRAILDDYQFHCLPDASRALAPCIWLLASEYQGGIIDCDSNALAFRLRQSVEYVEAALKPLIDNGFLIVEQDAIKPLADCKQDAMLEVEKEKEKSKRRGREEGQNLLIKTDSKPSDAASIERNRAIAQDLVRGVLQAKKLA